MATTTRLPPGTGVGAAIDAPARSPLRREAPDKLTGRSRYTDDIAVPGAWHGMTVRSTDAHARLVAIARDPAFDWSQVVVVTAAEIPGDNVVPFLADDQPALASVEIRHVGEPVALVAAPDRSLARAARDHLHPVTEALPPVFDPLESEQAFARYEISKGDLAAGFAAADLVVTGTYRVGHQEHLYLESQAMIAIPDVGGGFRVVGSMQCPFDVRTAVARALGLERALVVVVPAEIGGGFGGKEDYPSILAIHAALLARASGRAVRMIYDRHEDLIATTKRHPAVVTHRTGVTHDGRLVAQEIEIVMDAGAYSTLSPLIVSRGAIQAAGPYACPNVQIRARAMATNTPPNGAFRGFGSPQTAFAVETQVNRVAEALGVSPTGLRGRWAYRVGDTTPTGQVLRESVAAREVLDRATTASGFEQWRARTATRGEPPRGATATGVGLALAWHGAGYTGRGEAQLASIAAVELDADGRIRALASSTELGQGTKTILPQLVAEALGVPDDAVELVPVDTSLVPNSGPTVASRTTMIVGGLLVAAARRLRSTVEEQGGRPFAQGYRAFAATHGRLRIEERFDGYPGTTWDQATHRGDAYACYGWACAVARVDVDLDTGEVAVRSVVAADDVGRVINRVLAEGQVEGGTLQAVGYATIEETKVAAGHRLNDRMATCLVPTALDAPAITSILVEEPFSRAPHRAKGLGELPMNVGAPAVVAAIHDAIGIWITDLPATPEKILAALAAERVNR